MRFYGGLALILGGLFFATVGYLLTGLSVILASIETARGGMGVLNGVIADRRNQASPLPLVLLIHQKVAHGLLGWYCKLVDVMVAVYFNYLNSNDSVWIRQNADSIIDNFQLIVDY